MSERLVLLVDDEPSIRETVRFILEMEGYRVETAADGRQALEAIRRLRPRAVLLDAMMPELSGFDVCREVKGDPDLRDTVIIMLTAMGQRSDEERARRAGADHYVTKPFDEEEVLRLLEAAFARE